MSRLATIAVVLCLATKCLAQQTATPESKMVIEMRPGETHLAAPAQKKETKLSRWFELDTAAVSNRYQFIESAGGATAANHEQYQVALKGRFKFDAAGKYTINAGVFSGGNFFSGWNNSGWGSGRGTANLALKQLYFSAKPVRGVEVQYGSLSLAHGEATEVTAYDYDGYVTGQRLSLTRPDRLYFDEITYTAGYLGDINAANINRRYHRLRQVNFHHVVASKKLNERLRVSADYASEAGVNVWRQAVKIKLPETKVMDALLFENYQRAHGYGFNVYGEKKLHQRFTLGAGYAQIDRARFNSDRFPQGKRLHANGLITLTQDFSFTVGITHAVGALPNSLPRTRLDVGVNYNLSHGLKKAGLF
jgi:hypothetical protein